MKSLIFGIYGDCEGDKNVEIFSRFGARELSTITRGNLSLFFSKESTDVQILEHSKYLICLNGDSDFSLNELNLDLSPLEIFDFVLENSSGIFTFTYYNVENETLYISSDKFGFYPIFFYQGRNSFLFCNEYQPLILQNNGLVQWSRKNINFYFKYGFTLIGETFFRNLYMLKSDQMIAYSRGKISLLAKNQKHIKITSYENALDLLKSALEIAVKKEINRTSEFIVSLTGGLDSRLIFALIPENTRQHLIYKTLFTSPLNELNDKDVLISKIIADKYNLEKHLVSPFIEKTKDLDYSYFEEIRLNDIIKVTGLYGGEFLSNILYEKILPNEINEVVKRMFIKKAPMFFKSELKKNIKNVSMRTYYTTILTSSFFSSIYDGTEGAWVHPWMNSLRFFSPFMDSHFLNVWFSIPDEFLFSTKKSLYFDLYSSFFKEFQEIPTNSTLADLRENNFIFFEPGIEPKKVKKSKSNHLFGQIKQTEGYNLIPNKFKKDSFLDIRNQQQRVIDFCVWHEYIIKSFSKI